VLLTFPARLFVHYRILTDTIGGDSLLSYFYNCYDIPITYIQGDDCGLRSTGVWTVLYQGRPDPVGGEVSFVSDLMLYDVFSIFGKKSKMT